MQPGAIQHPTVAQQPAMGQPKVDANEKSDRPTKNISSNELEQREVSKIAEELKSQLKPIKKPHEKARDDHMARQSKQQAKSAPKTTDEKATEDKKPSFAISDLQPKKAATPRPAEDSNDTIYIDPDGTLHIKQDDAA
jgi:hypothetical protein